MNIMIPAIKRNFITRLLVFGLMTGLLLTLQCSSSAHAWWFGKGGSGKNDNTTEAGSYDPTDHPHHKDNAEAPPADMLDNECEPIREKVVDLNQTNRVIHPIVRPAIGLLKNKHIKCKRKFYDAEHEYLRHAQIDGVADKAPVTTKDGDAPSQAKKAAVKVVIPKTDDSSGKDTVDVLGGDAVQPGTETGVQAGINISPQGQVTPDVDATSLNTPAFSTDPDANPPKLPDMPAAITPEQLPSITDERKRQPKDEPVLQVEDIIPPPASVDAASQR